MLFPIKPHWTSDIELLDADFLFTSGIHHYNHSSLHSPSANTKEVQSVLYGYVSDLKSAIPEGVVIVAGDLNQATVRTVFPYFYQYMNFASWGKNNLDQVYSNIEEAFKTATHPAYLFIHSFTHQKLRNLDWFDLSAQNKLGDWTIKIFDDFWNTHLVKAWI